MQIKLVILFAFFFVSIYAQTRCWHEYTDMKQGYLPDCVDGCIDYGTLDAAAYACDANEKCQGLSYEFKANGGPKSIGPNSLAGWQLRSGNSTTRNRSNNYSYTFMKGKKICYQHQYVFGGPIFGLSAVEDCISQNNKCQASTKLFSAFYLIYQIGLKQAGTVSYSKEDKWVFFKNQKVIVDDYGISFFVTYIQNFEYVENTVQLYDETRSQEYDTCFDQCVDYNSLKEAQHYCNKFSECTGISYQFKKFKSGDKTVGYIQGYSYQLRKGKLGKLAKSDRAISWTKRSTETRHTEFQNLPTEDEFILITNNESSSTPVATPLPTPAPLPESIPTPKSTTTQEESKPEVVSPPVLKCAVLYKECNFQGESLEYCEPNKYSEWLQYKSLKVPKGQLITFYELNDDLVLVPYSFIKDIVCSNNLKS